jgi:hypothetical protein
MLIGETAASWIPQLLANLIQTAGASADDYSDFPSDWFVHFTQGAFKYGQNDDEWSSYGDILAMAGDYFTEYSDVEQNSDIIDTLLPDWHTKLADPSRTIIDHNETRMIVLAMSNWPHFGFEAIAKWKQEHAAAIDLAIRGRNGQLTDDELNNVTITGSGQTWSQITSGLMLALKRNAFADHFLSDLFSAGHMRVARKSIWTHLNEGNDTNQWSIPFLKFGGKQADVTSVCSGIMHDEDGQYGLWCKLNLGNCTLNGLDGASSVTGTDSGGDRTWDGPFSGDVGDFFALGDDHLSDDDNGTTRALCFYAVGLSIRDILIASITGQDPSGSDVQNQFSYWNAVGGAPSPQPVLASLRLVPRPYPPDANWQADRPNQNGQVNHFPFICHGSGTDDLEAYFDNMQNALCGDASDQTSSFQYRSTNWDFDPSISVLVSALSQAVTGCSYAPGSSDYFDLLDSLKNGNAGLNADVWRDYEFSRMIKCYGEYKGPGAAKEYLQKAKVGLQKEVNRLKGLLGKVTGAAKQTVESDYQAAKDRLSKIGNYLGL